MKIVGLITEYNPFHNGHSYHIEEAKRITGADAVIAVMSGDFVQRGEPAIMPKHLRTKCALASGASMVLELPVCYATASAEHFALGAVSILDRLGIVDSICFGSECGDLNQLSEVADILADEPESYQIALREGLKQGLSFPAARAQALDSYRSILKSPNNILGIEYLKALKRLNSSMKAHTFTRIGSYHDNSLDEQFASATAIRKAMTESNLKSVQKEVPESAFSILEESYKKSFPVITDDFSLLLKAKLLTETKESLTSYADISEELANRIINHRNNYISFSQFSLLLKTKELTLTRIRRGLLHILLGIREADMASYLEHEVSYYARVLGFRSEDSGLFRLLKENSHIPLITKLGQTQLSKAGESMLRLDLYAADLYESVITDHFKTPYKNEKLQQIVKL